MANQEVINLIKKEIEQGSSREQVVSNLIFAGVSYQEIQGALNQMAQNGELPQDFLAPGRRVKQPNARNLKVQRLEEATTESGEESSVREVIARHKKIIVSVLIVLVVLAAGGLIALYLYNTSTSVVLKKTLANLSSVSSAAFYVKTNADVNKGAFADDLFVQQILPGKITLESRGVFDAGKDLPIKFSLEISAKQGFDAQESSRPIWDVGSISSDGSALYFKLNNISTTTPQNRMLISQLMPTWVLVDATSSVSLFAVAPQKLLARLEAYRRAQSSAFKSAASLLSDPLIVSGVTSLGSQNIGKSSYYHYQIMLDQQKVGAIVSKIYSTAGISDEGWLLALIKGPWEVWIDKKSLLPYQITTKNETINSSLLFDPRDVTIILNGLNGQYDISPPAQFLPLSNILKIIQ